MHRRRWLAVPALLLAAGCVMKSDYDTHVADFNTWKASVQKSGNDVDAWIKGAHEVVRWVVDNGGTFCPSCDPPTGPPSPPPDGVW